MRLIILAAGRGTRLLPKSLHTPKSLIKLADNSNLLSRLLFEADRSKLFNEIVIVSGFHNRIINKFASERASFINCKISVYYNKNFMSPFPLESINTIKRLLDNEDFCISNSDSFFDIGTFEEFKNLKDGFTLVTYINKNYNLDSMKVSLDKKGNIKFINKFLNKKDRYADSTGLFFVKSKKYRNYFINQFNIGLKLNNLKYWHDIINTLINNNFKVNNLSINPHQWFELDNVNDLKLINNYLIKIKLNEK